MNSRILPALALMIAVGIFFVYVSPTWSGSIADAKTAISADEDALKAANDYTTRVKELTDQKSSIDQESISRLATFLPDTVDNVGLILDLNTLAARSGVSLSNIDVAVPSASTVTKPGAVQNPVSSVDLKLSAVGTYTAFQSFMAGIEKSARLLDIKDLAVKGSDTGVYSYDMTIRLYWLR